MRLSYRDRELEEELRSHQADLVEELLAAGNDVTAAQTKAQKRLGDMAMIQLAETTAIKRFTLPWHPITVIVFGYGVLTIGLWLVLQLLPNSIWLAHTEAIVIWWVFIGITAGTVFIQRWLVQFHGLLHLTVLWQSLVFALLISVIITGVLDIDNFEVNLHVLALSLIIGLSGAVSWKFWSSLMKRLVLYGFTALAALSALLEQPLFSFIGRGRCLFLTPDTTPLTGALAQCEQVQWWSPILFPLYGLLLFGIPYFFFHIWRYLKNSATVWYRKIVLTSALVGLSILPLGINNLNNYGELDVIPWKAEIYAAYWDILGRYPENKDIEFYARTRAYEHMSRLRQVLYSSSERRFKINLLFQDVVGRSATTAEIDRYANSFMTISDTADAIRIDNSE